MTALGRDGGDATGADVVVVAIPGDSIAQQVKAIVGGPTAKAFNTNFASIYDDVDAEPLPPGTLFASDPDALEATEAARLSLNPS
ncbi:hypothetical protein [Arthrobacter sp. 2RAF22]|uniref:hypothetical protein n=1 Tax=Arthrobacter sp. 2RAF22 TaxID=3232996 RepID=UPI003F8E4E57